MNYYLPSKVLKRSKAIFRVSCYLKERTASSVHKLLANESYHAHEAVISFLVQATDIFLASGIGTPLISSSMTCSATTLLFSGLYNFPPTLNHQDRPKSIIPKLLQSVTSNQKTKI